MWAPVNSAGRQGYQEAGTRSRDVAQWRSGENARYLENREWRTEVEFRSEYCTE
jgi:hypothetical protein